jgi:hypothetical protein
VEFGRRSEVDDQFLSIDAHRYNKLVISGKDFYNSSRKTSPSIRISLGFAMPTFDISNISRGPELTMG